ncbi:hypothetical protein [Sebaldella termitidis]|uniref:hypothetical protein n=1 Tax=Sebaldella termitidis TaxID=826 RepID=UPI003EB7C8F0
MLRNKKKFLFLLAFSSLLSAQSNLDAAPSNDKLQFIMRENVSYDLTNKKNYDIIEKVLRTRNKELKDLYAQSDYIVKPEYLEWQVFFSGFYEKTHRGGESTEKKFQTETPAKPPKAEPEPKRNIITNIKKSYKDTTITSRSSIDTNENVPYLIKLDSLNKLLFSEINIGDFVPVSVDLGKPIMPKIIDVNVSASPSHILVGTPQLNKFVILMPNKPEIHTPTINDIPIIKKPSTPPIPTVSANEFSPVEFNITPPMLSSPPVFNIKLGSFCNNMTPNCDNRGIDGGPLSGNPISFGSNGTNYNIAIGSMGNLGGGALTDGNPAVRYSWGTTASFNSTLLKVYFDYGSKTSNPGGIATLTADLTVNSINTLTTTQKNTENAAGRTWNTQAFLVGGSRIATIDNVYNATLINNGTMNLVGPFVIGFEVQTDTNYSSSQGKREMINRKTITDAGESTSAALNSIFPIGSSVNLNLPAYAGGGIIPVTRSAGGFTGYKIGLILTYENNDSNSNNSYVLTNEAAGLIDFKGEKSIGIQIYAPGSENVPIKVTNQGIINIGGIESYGLKLSSRANSTGMVFSNIGTINVSGNNGTGNSLSSAMAVIEDSSLTGNKSIRAYTNVVTNSGTINVSGGYGNSGMILKVAAADNITNSGTINVNGISNAGMRVDYGTVNTGTAGGPTAINNKTININDNGNFGIIANGSSGITNIASGTNNASGIIKVLGNDSAGLFAVSGGRVTNSASGQILISGTSSLGMVVGDSTSVGTNSGTINVTGNSSAGVYNAGTFNMNGGNITINTPSSVGIYSKPSSATSITGGVITVSNGSTALSAENSIINMSGPVVTVNNGGLFFYKNGTGSVSGTGTVNVNNNGTAFYITGGNTPILSSLVSSGNLTLNMAAGSTLVGWDKPVGTLSLNALTTVLGTPSITNTTINDLSSATYRYFTINKADVLVDKNVTLTGTGNQYFPRISFVSSSVQIGNGYTVNGTETNQIAIAQRNYTGSAGLGEIILSNNGIINLSGSDSTGIAGDFATINNVGTINISGNRSTGIFGANGSQVTNTGTINVNTAGSNNSGVGIYGTNNFDNTGVLYGTGKVNIINTGTIKYTGDSNSSGVGIYTDNNSLLTDSTITLNSGSNIDMSGSNTGVGIFADNSIININGGTVNAGGATGIYAIGGSLINASAGIIQIDAGGAGVYLTGNSQYNETGSQMAKFLITDDGASLFSVETGSTFNINPINIDNTTSMITNPYKFIMASVGNTNYTSNTTINMGTLENATIFGLSGSVLLLDTSSNLVSAGVKTVGIGVSGPKNPTVSYISGPYEVINNGEIILSGDKSTGIYAKGGAKALNTSMAGNLISVENDSAGMYAEGADSLVQNDGNIVIGESSAALYSSAFKNTLTEAGVINNGNITSQEIIPGIFLGNTTGIYVTENSEGYQKNGIINFKGKGSTGVFNEGNFNMSGGIVALQSLGGIAVYSKGQGANTEISGGIIDVQNGSVGLYADDSTIKVSGGTFNIGNEGLLMYNYPSVGTGLSGQLEISNSPTAIINNGGMGFYVEGETLGEISGILNNLVSPASTGTMFLDMKNGSSVLRWNRPVTTLVLSGIPSVGLVNGIDYDTLTAAGTDYKEYSINEGDLIIDKNINLKFLGNAYDGVEMSRSKVTLGTGYTIDGSLDGQVGIAQTNYKRTIPSVGDINDIVITNNGTISLSGKTSTGIAVDYGLINNNSSGILNLTGDNSVGILAANGSIVTNTGTVKVSGKESAGIYARNYFDGTAATSAAALGYGNNSINIINNGRVEILSSAVLNSEGYGIYLDNSVMPANMSALTLGTNSEIIIGDSNPVSIHKNTGISLINSTLTDNGGRIEVGVNGIGIYAQNSVLSGTGGVRSISQDSVGYYFGEVIDSTLQFGSIEVNGNDLAVYKLEDFTVPGINKFNTGNIELTSTDGGTFIVGIIGENRSLILDNEITIRKSVNGTLNGTVISAYEASLLMNTNLQIISEENSIIGVASNGQYTGGSWADSLNPNYELVFKGKMDLKNDSVGIYAEEGSRTLNDTAGEIKIGESSIGMYSTNQTTASEALNRGIILLNGSGTSGLRSDGTSTVINTGTIESLQDISGNYYGNIQGIVATNGSNAVNSGIVDLNGNSSVGIYNNNGNISMTAGNIAVNGSQSVGVYSKDSSSVTLISGGTIEAIGGNSGSAAALYAENSTIGIDNGTLLKASNNGILFYTSYSGTTPTGSFNLVSGTVQAEIGANGIGFYDKGDSSDSGLQTFLNTIFTGSGTLNIKLTDQSSKLFVIESTGGITNLSSLVPGSLGMLSGTKVTVDPLSVSGYNIFLINKGELNIDQNVNLDNVYDAYNTSEFISSKVTLAPGVTMTGTADKETAIVQKNFIGGTRSDIILDNNGGIITLSGAASAGMAADFGEIINSGTVEISGSDSIAILGANGSRVENTGIININSSGVGIYGANLLSTSESLYGDKTIEIENDGLITINSMTGRAYGIYAGNLDPTVLITDSTVLLRSNSVIDMSNSIGGVGIFGEKSKVTLDGEIKVSKDGIGVYTENSEVDINSLILGLNDTNSIGLYITGNEDLKVNGNIDINIGGEEAKIFYFNSTGLINGLGENLRISSIAPGSSFILGVLQTAQFNFTNSFNNVVELGNKNVTGITGQESVIRFGTNVTVNGNGNGQTAIMADGQSAVSFIAGYTDYEVVNEGNINLQNSSTGIYTKNGARIYNSGIINMGNNSIGISGKDAGSKIENNGNITVGRSSNALYLKNGDNITNYGNLNGIEEDTIGIHADSVTGSVDNYSNITFLGDKSVGIYSKGSGAQIINNYGTITVGNSSSIFNSSTGIYYNNSTPGIINSNNIIAGNKSVGIYNNGSTVNQNGLMKIGNESIGIYLQGNTATFNTGSTLEIGNKSVGVYSKQYAAVNVNSGNDIKIGDNSFGFVFKDGGIFNNITTTAKVVMGESSTYVYAKETSNISNNSNVLMNGSDSTGFVIFGGELANNGNINGDSGIGNTGVYIENGIVLNKGNINLGDSLINLKLDGTIDLELSNYTVGMYGINSQITNSSGASVTVGKNGVGIYSESSETNVVNQPTIINNGIINSISNGVFGMYTINSNTINNGLIELTGDNSTGIAVQNSRVTNNGMIIMRGNNSVGIQALAGSVIDNKGSIEIYGADSSGIITAPGTVILNSGNIYIDSLVSSASNEISVNTITSGYEKPILRTSGLVIVNDNFKLEGIDLVITPDPTTLQLGTVIGPDNEEHDFIVYTSKEPYLQANSLTVSEPIIVAPTYTKGTAANTYKIENVILTTSGSVSTVSGSVLMKSGSLTWDITPVQNSKGGYDIYAQRKNYTTFTDGLWYAGFGRTLEDNYLTSNGKDEKGEIYDKIDQITNEEAFRNNISSLAGDVYANINQREKTIADIFGSSLALLQNSDNNTKENVKINVIVGKGTVKENTSGVLDYDYGTAGILALREVERTYRHTFGYSLGYAHTSFEFDDKNNSEEWVDTIQLGIHNKYKYGDWILKNDLLGRVSNHNIDRNIDWDVSGRSEMNGNFQTYSITSDNLFGREFSINKSSNFTPYAGLEIMYVVRPTFEEDGLERLKVKGNDAWSVKPKAGIKLDGSIPLGTKSAWKLKGVLDLGYEYELADLNEREKARLVALEDGYHDLAKPQDEDGTLKTRVEIGTELDNRYGFFLTGEYSAGSHNQEDFRVGVSLKAEF